MYVREISIENLRCFEKLSIEFLYPGRHQSGPYKTIEHWPPLAPNVNVVLGDNGSGKSTVLDAIALAILSPVIVGSGYTPYSLVRKTPKSSKAKKRVHEATTSARLILHAQDAPLEKGVKEVEVDSEAKVVLRGDIETVRGEESKGTLWDGMFENDSPAFLLVGYSATRRVESTDAASLSSSRKQRQLRYQRVASLFEEHFALTPLATWLPKYQQGNPGRYKQVVGLIDKLLPQEMRFHGKFENSEYLFDFRDVEVAFGALSDGYRSYIGWIGDLLYHVCMGCPAGKKLVDNQGIVLIDEIDLHIHPAWQRTLIPNLAKCLPNLQFILTTHSPIVVGSLEQANIIEIKKRGSKSIAERPAIDTYGMSAEQILTSSSFGLDTTRTPAFQDELEQLGAKAAAGDIASAKELMRKAAAGRTAWKEGELPDWIKEKSKAQKAKEA